MEIDKQTSARLADAFQAFCDSSDSIVMPAGYRDSAFAVVDFVFSMQARYEGVRRVVANYASYANIPQMPDCPSMSANATNTASATCTIAYTGCRPRRRPPRSSATDPATPEPTGSRLVWSLTSPPSWSM